MTAIEPLSLQKSLCGYYNSLLQQIQFYLQNLIDLRKYTVYIIFKTLLYPRFVTRDRQ